MEIMEEGAVEIMEEGADARAGGKDATHEATTHAAAAPVPPEGSVAAILISILVSVSTSISGHARYYY
jgi:hypothetical protein